MPDQVHLSHGVMEGKGAYNKHATLPARGAALALPLLEKAVGNLPLDPGDRPIFIADYGSSQGKNSLAPVRQAITSLRLRAGPGRPIIVFHIDQPTNDFNSLFEVLTNDPDRYALDEPNVFPCESEDPSMSACFLPIRSISAGARMPRYGSAASRP